MCFNMLRLVIFLAPSISSRIDLSCIDRDHMNAMNRWLDGCGYIVISARGRSSFSSITRPFLFRMAFRGPRTSANEFVLIQRHRYHD
ncbi:hypothetical protein BD769DRAFT_1044740 [Suillus cothurnatus]|nr:hypothetical protein BD769DRAFT_1044740 [Suillus cothurnatus]